MIAYILIIMMNAHRFTLLIHFRIATIRCQSRLYKISFEKALQKIVNAYNKCIWFV